jgi:hypothetical protein
MEHNHLKKTDELKLINHNHINDIFRPLFFEEAIDIFWRHCSLAKKNDAPSGIGVISEYFTDHSCDRGKKEKTYNFLTGLGGVFRTFINFYPIYSACNDITPRQLFFYLWVEPILNPKLLSKLPKQHPLNQKQFVVLSENYQKFKEFDNDTLKFSENIRREILDLLDKVENKSFQLNPNKAPTYYGKMSEQIARWRDFYHSEHIQNDDIEKAILLYKSWRLIIETPCRPERHIHKVVDDKSFHHLLSFLKQIPSQEQITAFVNNMSTSSKVINAINDYYKNGFTNRPNKEQILIKLITTVPKDKLPLLFEDTPLHHTVAFFWSRLKFMTEYIFHDDPDIWLRNKVRELNGKGATVKMYESRNGLFWPWLLTEQLKWDLLKPYSPDRVIILSTKLLIGLLSKSDNYLKISHQIKESHKIASCNEVTFKNHSNVALNAFDVYIPDNNEVRSIIFLLGEFFATLSEDVQSTYRTISTLISAIEQLKVQRYNRFHKALQEIEVLIINAFIYWLEDQTKSNKQAVELNQKVCQQFTLMLKNEFEKINDEQHPGSDTINLSLIITAFRYKFTKYTKNSYDIFEKTSEKNGFISNDTLSINAVDFPQIQGYRWKALREYNLFISQNIEDGKQKDKLYANPLKRLEKKMEIYLKLPELTNNDDSNKITSIKSAFGSDLKKHLLPEVSNSYPYNMLKHAELLLSFFGIPTELNPAIKKYLKLDKKIRDETLNQLPNKDD